MGWLWMTHSDYESLPTKFNGVVFAVSWLASSLVVSIYEKTSKSKFHKSVISIGVLLFCISTTISVLLVNFTKIWILYSVYVIYLSIGQYLSVIYSEINKKLELSQHDDNEAGEENYFQAI